MGFINFKLSLKALKCDALRAKLKVKRGTLRVKFKANLT